MLIELLLAQAELLWTQTLCGGAPSHAKLMRAISSPEPGDWVYVALVCSGTNPNDRVGRLLKTYQLDGVTYHAIERADGSLVTWTNCEIRQLISGTVADGQAIHAGDYTWAADAVIGHGLSEVA